MFVDEIKIYARAGHGGRGCVAFQREKFRPKGGPSGGNGGRGGDVILLADHDLNNLIAQYYQPRLIAQKGEFGLGKGMDGHAGKDLVVKVPCGTLVWKLDSGAGSEASRVSAQEDFQSQSRRRQTIRPLNREESWAEGNQDMPASSTTVFPAASGARSRGELVIDLTEHGQRFVLCRGGRGGLGNRNFATATRQTPRFAQPGEPGEEGNYLLELRIMAEVGLVGYPNAGKSTLLTAISHARPKIAPYPFTTLHPQLGIVEYPDFHRLTVCDVPGLIEGAHRNVGLGHEFLRHIERCKVLVLLLDMAGTDGRTPWDDFKDLLRELELYDPALVERPRLVVANKMDEPAAEANLKKFKRRIRQAPILPIAAAFDQGIDKFKQVIRDAVK
ncbi:MAG TPA: GTPase ObgE [Candidatus Paceibacterota bacterium]|nr:GTPase ObgE [Verrucomicrobiota bacterium]HSA09772.1 GTPase ObgE [Candidatus Paceibacterota bacterium]